MKRKIKVLLLGFHSHHPSKATKNGPPQEYPIWTLTRFIATDRKGEREIEKEKEKEREGKKKEARPATKPSFERDNDAHRKREREREREVC